MIPWKFFKEYIKSLDRPFELMSRKLVREESVLKEWMRANVSPFFRKMRKVRHKTDQYLNKYGLKNEGKANGLVLAKEKLRKRVAICVQKKANFNDGVSISLEKKKIWMGGLYVLGQPEGIRYVSRKRLVKKKMDF